MTNKQADCNEWTTYLISLVCDAFHIKKAEIAQVTSRDE